MLRLLVIIKIWYQAETVIAVFEPVLEEYMLSLLVTIKIWYQSDTVITVFEPVFEEYMLHLLRFGTKQRLWLQSAGLFR